MIKTSIEKLAEEIGFDIANSDDVTQSNLLNGFFRGIHDSMNESCRQTQICYIVDKLDKKSIKIISEIFEFIKLKSE